MDKVVHFEIPTDNLERAQKFYAQFGWQIEPIPSMSYTIVRTVEVDDKYMPKESGAINGGMLKRQFPITSPVITISVPSIDNALVKIKENGGQTVQEKMPVGDMGYSAYFKDTEGNILGLWEDIKK